MTGQIIIVSGPAEATAAVALLPGLTITPWSMPGEPEPTAADWPGLAGQRLVVWPNAGGAAAATRAAAVMHQAGAASIKLIAPGALAAPGWGPVQALDEGWTADDLLDWLRERAVVWEPPAAVPGRQRPAPQAPDVRTEAEVGTPDDEPVAPPHQARGVTFDAHAPAHDKWAMLGLDTTKTGPVANEDNVMRVLERHPDLQNLLWFDEFLGRIMTTGAAGPREWGDADDVRLASSLQRDLGMVRVKLSHVRAAVVGVAFARVRNCAREWIEAQAWDGTERIQHFFPDAFGTPDTAYSRAVGRNFWISLVARVMRPGCKVDNMVILEGAQGSRKSSVLKAIGGEWFTVQHESITGKGFFEVLQGKMLVEIAEMDAFGKAEVTRVKQVVSTETDRYRESYGRYAKDHPRHSIFVGTTNKDDWNRDETGARRFWPIKCVGVIDTAGVTRARPQLFAEALAAFSLGQDTQAGCWWLMPDAETTDEQDRRREEETWEDAVKDWLDDPYKVSVNIREVLWGAVKIAVGDQQRREINRMTAVLHRIGWRKRHTAKGNFWYRPENEPSTGSAT